MKRDKSSKLYWNKKYIQTKKSDYVTLDHI